MLSACSLLAGCGTASAGTGAASPSRSTQEAYAGTWLDLPLPPTVLRLPLTDSTGHATSLTAYPGKVLVINDMMTLCQETCPLDTANLVAAAQAVQHAGLGDRVEFLSITVDPARDTPTQLAAYRKLFAPAPADWAVLTGSPATLAKLWSALGVYYQKVAEGTPAAKNWRTGQMLTYDVDHADQVLFIDPSGHERTVITGAAHVDPDTPLPATMRAFMDADGLANLQHPAATAWTIQDALDIVGTLVGRAVPLTP